MDALPARPHMIHLGGKAMTCCHSLVLIDCDGVYRCGCGRKQEARAQKIIEGMRKIEADLAAGWIPRDSPEGD